MKRILNLLRGLPAEYRRRRELHKKLNALVDPTFLDRASEGEK